MRIENNNKYNSREVYFDGKPSDEVIKALKALKMRWHSTKKCWYGFASEYDIINAANNAGETVMTEGYLGGGAIYGSKSNLHLYGAELSAAVRADLKAAKLPCKISVKVKTYSGGQSLYITVTLPKEYYVSKESYISDISRIRNSMNFGWITDAAGKSYQFKEWHEMDQEEHNRIGREFLTSRYETVYNGFASGAAHGRDDEYLTVEGNNLLKVIDQIVSAYNFDESNSMVDYFHTNFYHTIIVNQAA